MAEDPGVYAVVRKLDQACREAGFFYVKGHGIPDSLVREVKSVAHNFFELPYEEKVKIKMSAASGFRFARGIKMSMSNIQTNPVELTLTMECCVGLLTLVNQDDGMTALQVRNLSGEWISAPPIPGTFVCNIGDMLKIYSNGLYDSTLHQKEMVVAGARCFHYESWEIHPCTSSDDSVMSCWWEITTKQDDMETFKNLLFHCTMYC